MKHSIPQFSDRDFFVNVENLKLPKKIHSELIKKGLAIKAKYNTKEGDPLVVALCHLL